VKKKFSYLKRTYPKSKFERECDGYKYIIENSTEEEREKWKLGKLRRIIKKGEKYLYQVGVDDDKFKTMSTSLENYEIIRKYFFGNKDQ